MNLNDILNDTIDQPATTTTVQALPVPNLKLKLFPFQVDAVEFALGRHESYLALDMGLGKTPIGTAIASALAKIGQNTFVVVPPTLRRNWVNEIKKFAPHLRVHVIIGTTTGYLPKADVYIIGDSTLSAWANPDPNNRDRWDIHGKVDNLIVDEAHRHKNASNRSKALISLAETVKGRRILLSGTPIPNGRTTEMVNQLSILGPDAWRAVGGKGMFWTHYAPKQQYGRGSHDLEGLGQAMRNTFMRRQRRADVIDLPDKNRNAVPLEGKGSAVARYKAYEHDLIATLMSEGKNWQAASRAEAIVKLNKLRHMAGLAKVKAAIDHVSNLISNGVGGVFVIAEHTDVMDELLLGLNKFGAVAIRGGMSDKAKEAAKEAFITGQAKILVGQITAAGVGLTLHGDGINHHAVVVQMPWTPADLRQAEDRLHRIGQTNDVTIDVTLCEIEGVWTIDERLFSILAAKAFDTGLCLDGEGEVLLEDIQSGVLDTYRS